MSSKINSEDRWAVGAPHSPEHVAQAGVKGLAPRIQQLRLQQPVSKTAAQGPRGRFLL